MNLLTECMKQFCTTVFVFKCLSRLLLLQSRNTQRLFQFHQEKLSLTFENREVRRKRVIAVLFLYH